MWIHNHIKGIALLIEPIGNGDKCDSDRLTAYKKVYYDRLFKHVGLKVIKEGRFIWNNKQHEFELYYSTDNNV